MVKYEVKISSNNNVLFIAVNNHIDPLKLAGWNIILYTMNTDA